ncbi:homologous recombination OB-fold protein isoform X1 [Pygocentrus nattereri]|uniref:homologous recombination OB-fold protein isoform X1 n=2 Tax=Pygocentrus nattereri TaxID=42514 RepID=UPI000814A326|nr:homologous recombination OB-fold protein isoform X1 [Pygocentrus nattereri]
MTTTWGRLFDFGDDFDDEDLLEADWTRATEHHSVTRMSAAPASAPLQEPATSHTHNAPQSSSSLSTSSCNGSSETGSSAPLGLQEPSIVKGLRSLSKPNSSHGLSDPHKPTASLRAPLRGTSVVSSLQSLSAQSNPPPAVHSAPPQDDFDEWDVDLEELDESLFQKASGPGSNTDSISPAKRMRSSSVAEDTTVVSSHRSFCSSAPTSRPPQSFVRTPCPSTFVPQGPPQSLCQPFVRNSSVCRFSSPGPVRASAEGQRGVVTPRASQGHQETLFQAISPATSQTRTPRPLNTPVLTNHLVQLVSAASKTPQRPRSGAVRSKMRRFPGPAGALPQQISGQNLDDIVVTVPQTPAHGAVARLQNEVPSSQVSEEEEFSGGPWAAMKAEMGLDERNPSCFLHSYSIVMVLRKAALRQLVKNKVPNMAVVLKSILHTHADGKAAFRDPTGEIQGTVHRRLLEDRQGELKTGAVLLLKQVGVFSPSHRNHYLNVTPNNLLKIYPPDGALPSSSQLAQPVLESVGFPQCESSRPVGGPVSQMELRYDDEEEEEEEAGDQRANPASSVNMVAQSSGPDATEEALWGSDDLDELLGELPVE